MCLKSIRTKSKWYIDSGYSRYMTGDKEQFNKLDAKDGGHVTFGDNAKGKIIDIGEIGNPQSLSIHMCCLLMVLNTTCLV